MCLMAQAPRKASIPRDYLQNAYDHNSDGWGVMYADAGRVVCRKEKSGMEEFYAMWDALPANKNVAVHFRFGTSGPQNSAACHPFKILSKDDGDPFDLYGMHNGVLRDARYGGTAQASDTMQYFAAMTRQLRIAPALLYSKDWRKDQEALLGNPNKVILLEGNGRWTYLNRQQGDVEAGVWYSNTYSLKKVYSGHGKGRAASRTKETEWEWDYGAYAGPSTRASITYPAGAAYGDATRRMDDAYRNTIGAPAKPYKRPWAMRMGGDSADSHEYWRPVQSGYERYAKNPSTGIFYRDFAREDEPKGADHCIVLPTSSIIRFTPKNEQAFLRGDLHTFTMEGGEHVAVPVSNTTGSNVTLYKAGEARAAVQRHEPGPLLDLRDVAVIQDQCGVRLLCLETNEPCAAGCETRCTMGGASNHASTFPVQGDATHEQEGVETSVTARLATLEEAMDAQAEEDDSREIEYVTQLFSENNLRGMTEDEMQDAVLDYPEDAALALGAAYNCKWAYEEKDVG